MSDNTMPTGWPATTIRTLLERTAARYADRPAQQYRQGGVLREQTYAAFAARVRQVSELAGRLGIEPRTGTVALLLENGPAWTEIYSGLSCCGVTLVPVDPKLRAAEVGYMLQDAETTAIFTDTKHAGVLAAILPGLPALRSVVWVDAGASPPALDGGRVSLDYETALAEGASDAAGSQSWYARHAAEPDDVASLIYTSGTTGRPKGAMLTHANFCADAEGALQVFRTIDQGDRFLVVLPLFHSFAFTANYVIALRVGACLQFVENLRSVGDDMRALRPTILMAVPLLVEKVFARVQDGLRRSRSARLLLAVGLRAVVARRVRASLGGELRLMVTGGAPCPVPVIQGWRRLGIPIVEGYGLTEASPVVSLSTAADARPGTIGYALPNIEVRIAEPDERGVGELQVRGPITMRGYHRNPAATAEAFDGDWLRTGDLASIDDDGYITIRGRRKALIVNREGKNIYPEEVELCLGRSPLIRDVLVIGYRDQGEVGEKVGAIVVPDLDAIASAAGGNLPGWAEVETQVRQAVHAQCRDLADYKHPRKLDIRRDPLERTSTQKVRRHLYEGQLDTQ